MNNLKPIVSIIMPVRNEEAFIEIVLTNISNQDYPHEKIEVIIVDGQSDDATLGVINNFRKRHPNIKIITLSNLKKIVPIGLNIALGHARGEVVVRMDAHAEYPKNYVTRLVEGQNTFDADNIGGVVETCPSGPKAKSKAIAFSMGHPAGVGNSYFRIGTVAPREVDTVPFGCFRRKVFDKIGMFDEELVRNQDDEFNGRMRSAGMKIVLLPDLKIRYFARESWRKLFRMFFQYGLFKPMVVKKLRALPTWRQLIPPFFVLFLIFGSAFSFISTVAFVLFLFFTGIYFLLLTSVAVQCVVRHNINTFFFVLISLFLMHFSYGLGYLKGLYGILVGKKGYFNVRQTSR